jgi:hypothetical protein
MPELPELRIDDWRPTKDTLHLFAQIVGKVRLATTPPRNHWWHAPLYLDVRGLTTGPIRQNGTTFDITLDLVGNELVLRTAGERRAFPLADGLTVANFDEQLHSVLGELGVDVAIHEQPYGAENLGTTPFPDDTEHASWDRDAVARFHAALDWSASVLEEFSGWFAGKQSPVQFMWQSFDLSLTRFTGRPSGITSDVVVNREAYTHEVFLVGFNTDNPWTGHDASFYAFMVPEPKGYREAKIAGAEHTPVGIAMLPWEDVRAAPEPRAHVLEYLESAYETAMTCAGVDLGDFRSAWHPVKQ